MTPPLACPRLTELMAAYFNQDAADEDDAALLDDYAQGHWVDEVAAAVAELDALLATATAGLLARFEAATGEPEIAIADDDTGARAWLAAARARLAAAGGRSRDG